MRKRLEKLEARVQAHPARDEAAELRRALLRATLDEIARLRRSRVVDYGQTEAEDIPRQFLGEGYTAEQLVDLAIARVWEREDLDEDLRGVWAEAFKELCARKGANLEALEDPLVQRPYPGDSRL